MILRLLKYTFLFLLAAIILASVLLYIFWPGIEGRLYKSIHSAAMRGHFNTLIENSVKKAPHEIAKKMDELQCEFLTEEYKGSDCISPLAYKEKVLKGDMYCDNNYYIRDCHQAYFHSAILENPEVHAYFKTVMQKPCKYIYRHKLMENLLGCRSFLSTPIWLTYLDENGNFVKNEIVE